MILAAAGLVYAAPALAAQQTPPASAKKPTLAAKAPAGPPKTADAANPTPSHLAAARKLVVVSGMSRSFTAAIPSMMRQLVETWTQTRPDLAAPIKEVLKKIRPEFKKDTARMVDRAARIYARLLTEKDIDAAIAFFTSPAGKRYVHSEPYYFNDVINAMQDWHQEVSAEMMAKVRSELKKKGYNL